MKGKIRKSLKASFWDGAFAAGMVGITESYVIPYALALRAQASQIGILASVPNLIMALANSQINKLTRWIGSRKKVVLIVVLIQAIALTFMSFLPMVENRYQIISLIILTSIATTFGGLASAPWGSLMCEYLPLSKRSGYFGWRSRVLGMIIIASSLLAGGVLQYCGRSVLAGFAILFALAATFRLFSWFSLRKMFEPVSATIKVQPAISETNLSPTGTNFNAFLLFTGAMSFGVNLSAPMIHVYMLKTLHYSYLTYTIALVASTSTTYFMMAPWGRHADHAGNLKIIRMGSAFIQLIPFLWLVSGHPVYIVAIQLVSGVAWSGYNLCVSTYIFDSVSQTERVRQTARFNMMNGVCVCLGAGIGTSVMPFLPFLKGTQFMSLLILSGLARMGAVNLLLPKIKEVRKVTHVESMDLFNSVIGLRPLPGVARDTNVDIRLS